MRHRPLRDLSARLAKVHAPLLAPALASLLALGLSLGCGTLGMMSQNPADPANPGAAAQSDAPVVHVAWSRSLVGELPLLEYKPQEFAAAAVGEHGILYVGSSYKNFFALRARDGRVMWSRELTGGVSSEPLYLPAGTVSLTGAGQSALVVVGDDDGALTAMDARSGAVRWVYRVRGSIRVKPTYSGGLIYFTSGEGRLYAIDAATGKWKWQYEREVPETFTIRGGSAVTVSAGRAYAGFPDGYLAALNAQSGEVVWTRQLSGDVSRFTDVDGTPILWRDTLYVSSYATGVYALDVKDGSTRWHFDLEAAGQVAFDPQTERIYVTAAQVGVHCLDRQGRLLWRQALGKEGELSAPTLWGRYLLFAAASGGVYVVRAKSGELMQYFDPGHGVTGKVVAEGRYLFFLGNGAAFFAMETG